MRGGKGGNELDWCAGFRGLDSTVISFEQSEQLPNFTFNIRLRGGLRRLFLNINNVVNIRLFLKHQFLVSETALRSVAQLVHFSPGSGRNSRLKTVAIVIRFVGHDQDTYLSRWLGRMMSGLDDVAYNEVMDVLYTTDSDKYIFTHKK